MNIPPFRNWQQLSAAELQLATSCERKLDEGENHKWQAIRNGVDLLEVLFENYAARFGCEPTAEEYAAYDKANEQIDDSDSDSDFEEDDEVDYQRWTAKHA